MRCPMMQLSACNLIALQDNLVGAVFLGVANFVGVFYLSNLLASPALAGAASRSQLVSLASSLMPFLKAYAASFFTIPLVRSLENARRNQKIDKRNRARKRVLERISQTKSQLRCASVYLLFLRGCQSAFTFKCLCPACVSRYVGKSWRAHVISHVGRWWDLTPRLYMILQNRNRQRKRSWMTSIVD